MEDDDKREYSAAVHRIATWLLAAATSVGGTIVWSNHVSVSEHRSLFDSVWSPEYKRALDGAVGYAERHEAYRKLYIEEDARFKAETRQNCREFDRRLHKIEQRLNLLDYIENRKQHK